MGLKSSFPAALNYVVEFTTVDCSEMTGLLFLYKFLEVMSRKHFSLQRRPLFYLQCNLIKIFITIQHSKFTYQSIG